MFWIYYFVFHLIVSGLGLLYHGYQLWGLNGFLFSLCLYSVYLSALFLNTIITQRDRSTPTPPTTTKITTTRYVGLDI